MKQPNPFRNFSSKEFHIWLAGFFDGEGCIYIPKQSGIEVNLSSTTRLVIEAIHSIVRDGSITRTTHNQPNWKTKHSLRLRRYQEAKVFLLMIRPFLTIKRRMADLALLKIKEAETRELRRKIRNERILELASEGFTQSQIAKKIGGMTQSNVGFIIRETKRRGFASRIGARKKGKGGTYRERHFKKLVVVTTRSRTRRP